MVVLGAKFENHSSVTIDSHLSPNRIHYATGGGTSIHEIITNDSDRIIAIRYHAAANNPFGSAQQQTIGQYVATSTQTSIDTDTAAQVTGYVQMPGTDGVRILKNGDF